MKDSYLPVCRGLAFSVAINVDPEVLIIDEALSVGDVRFQQKCFRKFKEFKNAEKTIIFVSHDTGSVVNYCDRAIWLMDGVIHQTGKPEDVTKNYLSYMYYGMEGEKKSSETINVKSITTNDINRLDLESVKECQSFGEGGASIRRVGLFSESDEKIKLFKGGEKVNFYVELEILKDIDNPIVGFTMKDQGEMKF